MRKELVSPCGISCETCVSYLGYTMEGKPRKHPCEGCRIKDKECAFLKRDCEKLSDKRVEYCFECEDFPCEDLKKLDERYRGKYGSSLIGNLEFIEENGIEEFLRKQEEEFRCPTCGGTICIHTGLCYECGEPQG